MERCGASGTESDWRPVEGIREHVKNLEAEIVVAAKTLPGFEGLVSIKGIGALSVAVILVTIGNIKDFRRARQSRR